jgi:hypothetical protein
LENEKGKKVPLTEQNIERLPPEVINFLNQGLEQEESIKRAFVQN